MNILQKFFITSLALFSSLSLAYAAGEAESLQEGITTIGTLISSFTDTVLSAVVTLLMSFAILVFFWGIVEYITGMREGNPDKVTKGNKFIMWGLVGLFVMFSVYGIIKFGQGIFGFKESDLKSITIPTINTGSGGSATNPGRDTTPTRNPLFTPTNPGRDAVPTNPGRDTVPTNPGRSTVDTSNDQAGCERAGGVWNLATAKCEAEESDLNSVF